MHQFARALSLAVSIGISIVAGLHLAAPVAAHHASPAPSRALAGERPRAGSLKLDGETVSRWTATEAAAEAQAAADAAAAAAAAAAAERAREAAATVGSAPSAGFGWAHTSSPGAAAVKALIVQDFSPLGQSAVDWGLRVAACESGYNPNSYNPDGASGVFQFMPGTFRATPYGSQNIFDASANVAAAAWYYGRHGGGAWSCK